MKHNNTVIKVLNKEHGKKVIEWWKKQGVDTRELEGSRNEEQRDTCIYYGLHDGYFDYNSLEFVIRNNIKIIQLPSETSYPKLMWVSDNEKFNNKLKRVVFMEKNNKYIAWSFANTLEGSESQVSASGWPYAKDIEEEIVELTLEDITNGKGVGVPAHLLRIKK